MDRARLESIIRDVVAQLRREAEDAIAQRVAVFDRACRDSNRAAQTFAMDVAGADFDCDVFDAAMSDVVHAAQRDAREDLVAWAREAYTPDPTAIFERLLTSASFTRFLAAAIAAAIVRQGRPVHPDTIAQVLTPAAL
jgi:hypothetical protein